MKIKLTRTVWGGLTAALLIGIGVLLYAYPVFIIGLLILMLVLFGGYLVWQRSSSTFIRQQKKRDDSENPEHSTSSPKIVLKADGHGSGHDDHDDGRKGIGLLGAGIIAAIIFPFIFWFFVYGAGSILIFGDSHPPVKVSATARDSMNKGRSGVSLAQAAAASKAAAAAERKRILELKIPLKFDYDHPPEWTQVPYGVYHVNYKLTVGKQLYIQCSSADIAPPKDAALDDASYACTPEMLRGDAPVNWFRPLAFSKSEGTEQADLWFTANPKRGS